MEILNLSKGSAHILRTPAGRMRAGGHGRRRILTHSVCVQYGPGAIVLVLLLGKQCGPWDNKTFTRELINKIPRRVYPPPSPLRSFYIVSRVGTPPLPNLSSGQQYAQLM